MEITILSEVRERQLSYDITYMWNLKYDRNELIQKTETHKHRKQTYDYQRGSGGRGAGINQKFGFSRYKLLYIKQINKVLLYSTGNSIHYPVINHNGKEYEKEYIGTSLVAQWLRIRLPMQGTQVRAMVWEDPTCHRATKLVCHNY